MGTHVQTIESIGNILKKTPRSAATDQVKTMIPDFDTGLRGTKRKAEEMVTAVEISETDASQRFTSLEAQMQEMQSQLNDLMETKAYLHIGQTAYDFENDLAGYIYPPEKVRTYNDRQIFSNLMKWLKENGNKPVGREPNEKWESLKKEFAWTRKHERVFLKMLKFRIAAAHPQPVNFEVSIPDKFTADEKSLVKDIREMAVKLRNLSC